MSTNRKGKNKDTKKRNKNNITNKNAGMNEFSRKFVLPLSCGEPFPESVTVVLNFNQGSVLRLPVLGNFFAFSLGLNTCFDIDPLIGGATMVGFVQWAAIYRHYLGLEAFVTATFVNNDDFEVGIAMAPTDFNLTGNVTSAALATAVGELDLACVGSLSAKGGIDRKTLTRKIDLGKFVGNPLKLKYDDLYSALVNTVPGNPLYMLFVGYSLNTFVKGVTTEVKVTVQTKFWGRQSPLL